MYELVILGFLMRRPHHGYLIAKIINDIIGPFARLSNGRLYPLLAKLEQEGFIAAVPAVITGSSVEGAPDRQPRAYEITGTGRQRFHELMMDTTSYPGEYQRLFWFKLANLPWLEPEERLYLLDHYINFCQTHLFHLENESRDLERKAEAVYLLSPEQRDASLRTMQHLQAQWQLELASAHAWRAREVGEHEVGEHESVPEGKVPADPGLGAGFPAEDA
jgi:DNA-binding PadR family transcriptional regulator